jgi:hypothetical protein
MYGTNGQIGLRKRKGAGINNENFFSSDVFIFKMLINK